MPGNAKDRHWLPPTPPNERGYGGWRCSPAEQSDSWTCECCVCAAARKCRSLSEALCEARAEWSRAVRSPFHPCLSLLGEPPKE